MKKIVCLALFSLLISYSKAQNPLLKDGFKFRLNEDGSQFIQLTFLNQTWIRFTENNPQSTVFGKPESSTFDIGLRRTRFQLFGQVSDRVFVYTQFGLNNFTYATARKTGFFIHDAIGEYAFVPQKLSIGAGLTGWTGFSRFSSPSAGTIMGLDAPLFEQATNDITDQFLRKLSVYAKGKIGKLDYRIVLSKPMTVQTASASVPPISENSNFSYFPPKIQTHGYLMYQFLEQESNLTPYTAGTYLGKKKVFNIGTGFMYQADAMWRLGNTAADTVESAMKILALDFFYDAPINAETGTALSAYLALVNMDFGKNYIRNLGVMNPTNGVGKGASFNGTGNAFPIEGTGTTVFAQVGYLAKKDLLGNQGTLMPYLSMQYGDYEALNDKMLMWSIGMNWFIVGHKSKISVDWQNRPIFQTFNKQTTVSERKGMFVLQYLVSF